MVIRAASAEHVSERGQAFLLIVVVRLRFCCLACWDWGTDYAQIWAHTPMTQGAADAACQAAAADLFLNAVDPEAESTYGIDFS
jgi:hypothetical protein